jgi:hypothetical protein
MVALTICAGCMTGDHDKHAYWIQKPPEGVMGGFVCGCSGPDECAGNGEKLARLLFDLAPAADNGQLDRMPDVCPECGGPRLPEHEHFEPSPDPDDMAGLRGLLNVHLAGRAVTLDNGTRGLISHKSWTEIVDGICASARKESAALAARRPATDAEQVVKRVEALARVLTDAAGQGPLAAAMIFGALSGGDLQKLAEYERAALGDVARDGGDR